MRGRGAPAAAGAVVVPAATQAMAANYAPDLAPPSGSAGPNAAADPGPGAGGAQPAHERAGSGADAPPSVRERAKSASASPIGAQHGTWRSPFERAAAAAAPASASADPAGASPRGAGLREGLGRRFSAAGESGGWRTPQGGSPTPSWTRRESFGANGASAHAFHFVRPVGGSPREGSGLGVGLLAAGRRSSIGGGETVMQRSLSVTSETATLLGPFDPGAPGAERGFSTQWQVNSHRWLLNQQFRTMQNRTMQLTIWLCLSN